MVGGKAQRCMIGGARFYCRRQRDTALACKCSAFSALHSTIIQGRRSAEPVWPYRTRTSYRSSRQGDGILTRPTRIYHPEIRSALLLTETQASYARAADCCCCAVQVYGDSLIGSSLRCMQPAQGITRVGPGVQTDAFNSFHDRVRLFSLQRSCLTM